MARTVYRITVGEKIKDFRDKCEMSQSSFGKMLGVSPQAVCKWEMGVSYPDIILLPVIAEILGCTIDEFFMPITK